MSDFNGSWLAFDMFFGFPERDEMQKRTMVLYFTTETTGSGRDAIAADILENGLEDTQSNIIHSVPSINGDGKFRVKDEQSIVFVDVAGIGTSRPSLMSNMLSSIQGALQEIFDYGSEHGGIDVRFKATVYDDLLEQGNESTNENIVTLNDTDRYTLVFETIAPSISEAENGGILYIYRNPWLKETIESNHYTSRFGQLRTDNEFRIVPADRRKFVDGNSADAPKLVTLAGVLSSPLPSTVTDVIVHRGQQTMMQKLGTIGGFSNLEKGKKVYLGYNGHVTQRPQDIVFDEYVVEIGVARSDTEIDVRLGDAELKSTTRDTMPVSTIVPRAYDLSQEPPVAAEPPPGFLALEGQKLKAEEYPDLYRALTGEDAHEHSPMIVLHNDPSHIIKAFSFNLFPDTATPELPVQARRYETPWQRISGDQVYAYDLPNDPLQGDWTSEVLIPHGLTTSIRDTIGYVVLSVTDQSGSPTDAYDYPIPNAPQFIMYPGFGSDGTSTFGFQFQEHSMNTLIAKLAGNGLKVVHDGSLTNVEAHTAEQIMAGAENWVAKFVIYKIENIYDFKDDRLVQKANKFWYDHQRRYYWDDDVEVHGVRATTIPDEGTLIRRDENKRAQVDFPYDFIDVEEITTAGTYTYTDAAIESTETDEKDITNKDYVTALDTANRNWTQGHIDRNEEGIHGSSYEVLANRLIHRDNEGRAQVGDPDHDKDAVNKQYLISIQTIIEGNISELQDDLGDLQEYVDTEVNNAISTLQQDLEDGIQEAKDYTDEMVLGLEGDIEANPDTLVQRDEEGKTRIRLFDFAPTTIGDGDIWLE